MCRLPLGMIAIGLLATPWALADAQPEKDYPHRPVPFTQVQLDDAFWSPRIQTNRTVTVPFALGKSEETGRIENFKVAGGLSEESWIGGFGFNDSDVSKIIEGASYCLTVEKDPKLDAYLDQIISYYAAAQEDDGFLYTLWTARDTAKDFEKVICRPNKDDRWSSIHHAHQLYNSGHMYEAGVAHFLATGKRSLLDVCLRNADLVCDTFNAERLKEPPGHQEIEIGLAKLYRVTGNRKYLDQARFFLELRGRHGHKSPYNQTHRPVTEQDEAVGHAVRANYMYAGMADVAALLGDQAYVTAIDRIWQNVVSKKLYITGGTGATGQGEAYGDNYELPNRTAYCETCAAIANVYWNHRMFGLHGEAKYVDVMERSLYNNVLSGVAMDGKTFFYPNPLASVGGHARSPWFGCACCPSNITRFIASVGGYMYGVRGEAIYVNLFARSSAQVKLGDRTVTLVQKTDYPWNGNVAITVTPDRPGDFALHVRIPGWAFNEPVPSDLYHFAEKIKPEPYTDRWERSAAWLVKVNGKEEPAWLAGGMRGGYAVLQRRWQSGDVVELNLPMPIRRVLCNGKVKANRGRVALERGPIVYCIEHPDVPDGKVGNLMLPDDAQLATEHRGDLLGGVTVITGRAQSTRWVKDGDQKKVATEPVTFTAIPYYAWAHRGTGEMAVWLPREVDVADPLRMSTIASRARPSSSFGNAVPINDQREPKTSGDHTHPFLHFWPHKGTAEWVQYDFDKPHEVSRVAVYWFDDTGRGECRLPASWKLRHRQDGKWREVDKPGSYGCQGDQYNLTTFTPVTTDGLRIEVQLQPKWASGVHEWLVE